MHTIIYLWYEKFNQLFFDLLQCWLEQHGGVRDADCPHRWKLRTSSLIRHRRLKYISTYTYIFFHCLSIYLYVHTYIPIRTHTLHIFFYCRYREEKNGILLFEGLEISNLVRSILNSQSITLKYFRDKKNITTLIFRRKLWIATRCEHFAFLNDISVSWTIGMIIIHSYKVS